MAHSLNCTNSLFSSCKELEEYLGYESAVLRRLEIS